MVAPSQLFALHQSSLGGSRRNIVMFGVEKLEWFGYTPMKNLEDTFIRFDRVYELDWPITPVTDWLIRTCRPFTEQSPVCMTCITSQSWADATPACHVNYRVNTCIAPCLLADLCRVLFSCAKDKNLVWCLRIHQVCVHSVLECWYDNKVKKSI